MIDAPHGFILTTTATPLADRRPHPTPPVLTIERGLSEPSRAGVIIEPLEPIDYWRVLATPSPEIVTLNGYSREPGVGVTPIITVQVHADDAGEVMALLDPWLRHQDRTPHRG